MAFHEIDSVTDINSGHRVIIYYIECKPNESDANASTLLRTVEAVMRTLEKKNDDVLIVKVQSNCEQFTKFQQLYKADTKGQVTLFVVNNEGIPIVSEHIYDKENISAVILSICKYCALNPIPTLELDVKSDTVLPCTPGPTNINDLTTNKELTTLRSAETISQTELNSAKEEIKLSSPNHSAIESLPQNENYSVDSLPTSTQLQIRLPDGSRHKQQFDIEAKLNEVWVFISTQYKLKDFDLKTYNHHNFSEEEYESTLKELDLYPNGVVIVVPKLRVRPYINNEGWIRDMFRYGLYQLVSKTTSTLGYIQGLCILLWNRIFFSNNRRADDDNLRRNQVHTTQKTNNDNSSSQRRSKTSTTSFGNIHTLRRNDDSDDENNRYNGNSTQQK